MSHRRRSIVYTGNVKEQYSSLVVFRYDNLMVDVFKFSKCTFDVGNDGIYNLLLSGEMVNIQSDIQFDYDLETWLRK